MQHCYKKGAYSAILLFHIIPFHSSPVLILPYARKFLRYVNFADFMVTYGYSKNLIRENLLV